jgi:CelD/BcsL family acetyltransferase involved in cellulose biosynthesis
VRLVRDTATVRSHRADWERLRTDEVTPFTSLDYVCAHVEALRDGDRPCLVGLFEDGRLTALAPLVRRGRRPRRLEWLDGETRSSALYCDEDRLERLIDAIYALRLPIACQTLVPGGATERVLDARRPRGWTTLTRTWTSAPCLPLDREDPDPLMRLSRNRRSQLRRKLRRAGDLGEVEFAMHRAGEDLDEAFDEFVRLEASGWKGRAGTALAHDRQQRETLRRYLLAPAVREATRIASMRIGAQTVAMHLDVAFGGRLWSVKTAIDEDYKDVMPGFLIYEFTIRSAAEEGLTAYEFLGERELVKEIWGGEPVELHRRRFYPPNVTGLTALVDEVGRKGAGELFERFDIGRVAGRG